MELDEQALAILDRAGLRTRRAEIEAVALPGIGVRLRRAHAAELAPTASRFGGPAWSPPGTSRPDWEGERLPFLGQINLADVVDLARG